MTEENVRNVFIFDSWMTNQKNHDDLHHPDDESEMNRCLGRGITMSSMKMYFSSTDYTFVIQDEQGCNIHGEIWELNAKTVKRLDKLDHNLRVQILDPTHSYCCRMPIDVQLDDTLVIKADMYVSRMHTKLELAYTKLEKWYSFIIESGDFRDVSTMEKCTHYCGLLKSAKHSNQINKTEHLGETKVSLPQQLQALSIEAITPSLSTSLFNHAHANFVFTRIFAFLVPTEQDRVSIRCLCKLFRDSLESLPLYLIFPNEKYKSLNILFHCLSQVYKNDPEKVPILILIVEGIYEIDVIMKCSEFSRLPDSNYLEIDFPITIKGIGNYEKIRIIGGIEILKGIKEKVNLMNLSICGSKDCGVLSASPFVMDNVAVLNSLGDGVVACEYTEGSCTSVCRNVKVFQSGLNGISVFEGCTIKLISEGTCVRDNCRQLTSINRTEWDSDFPEEYGVFGLWVEWDQCASDQFGNIFIVHPLTKEIVSTMNNGRGNWDHRIELENNIKEI